MVLRLGLGCLWVFDGILQAQPMMVAGLPSQVIAPTAAGSPRWARAVVGWGGAAWSNHPVQAAAAAVWIQVGLGLWLLAAKRGLLSRLAGLASLGWGLTVWAFGESFGGIFAPGLSWLSGAPGAVLIYCVAGALIALPGRPWRTARLGRLWLAGTGVFLIGMAVLQAWPGRGFWEGTQDGRPGTLTGMIQAMSAVPQPRLLARAVAGFGSFAAAHGFAVNLFTVVSLAVAGAAFISLRPALTRLAVAGFTLLCLVDWLLVQDRGFLGGTGTGTDPNSMLPFVLLAWAGYVALTRPTAVVQPDRRRRVFRMPMATAARGTVGSGLRLAVSVAAIGVFALGVGPLAAARAIPVGSDRPVVSLSRARGVTRLAITWWGSAGHEVGRVKDDGYAERKVAEQ